jgi:hypothetical protein
MANKKRLFIENMSPYQIRSTERRMRPGSSSIAGFLGMKEDLVTIIDVDTKILERLGITHKQISDRLESISGRYVTQCDSLDLSLLKVEAEGILIDGKFQVKAATQRGIQECPFAEEADILSIMEGKTTEYCGTGSRNYTVKNLETGESIRFADLMIHLVRDHNFFQGPASPYRLDPEAVVRILEIKPGVDYAPKIITTRFWNASVHISPEQIYDDDQVNGGTLEWLRKMNEVFENADESLDLTPKIKVVIKGDLGYLIATEDVKLESPLMVNGLEIHGNEGRLRKGFTKIYRNESTKVVG